MKKIILTMALTAFILSMNINAQSQEPVQKKKKTKTEKTCSAAEKKGGCCANSKSADNKSCESEGKSEKKAGCCSAKKS